MPSKPSSLIFSSTDARRRAKGRIDAALIAIVGVYVVWSLLLTFRYPFFDMADELFHFDYVYRLSIGHGLINIYKDPIQDQVFNFAVNVGHWQKETIITPAAKGVITDQLLASIRKWGWYPFDIAGGHSYEGVQPPLFYSVAAAFVALVEPMVWKAYIARIVTVGFSVLTLLTTYFLLRRVSRSQYVSLGAILILAVTPAWQFESFRISNEMASKFLIVLTLLIFFLLLDRKLETKPIWAVTLGAVLGLAMLTRFDAAIVLGPTLLASYIFLSKDSYIAKIRSLMLVAAVALAVSGWFYARNMALYGELSGAQTIVNAVYFGKNLDTAPNLITALWLLLHGFAGYFVFSPYLLRYNSTLYTVAGAFWLISLSFIFSRVFFDLSPTLRRNAVFVVPIIYVSVLLVGSVQNPLLLFLILPLILITLKPKKGTRLTSDRTLSMLFYSSIIPVALGASYFLTFVGPISERYFMAAAPFGAGFMLYALRTATGPRWRTIFLILIAIAFALAGISQQYGQITWLLENLRR